jgi:hypothetical protein
MIRNFGCIVASILVLLSTASVALAAERLIDNGDGTVTDRQTGLMWARSSSPGDLTWQDAETYCKMPAMDNLYLKYEDWRMPTIEELKTLYLKEATPRVTTCGLKIRVAPIFEISCAWIWSGDLPPTPQRSTEGKVRKVRSIMAYVFDLGRGFQYADRMVHKKNLRALPVRGPLDH